MCEWTPASGGRAVLAVADVEIGDIRLFDATDSGGNVLRTVKLHSAPVLHMARNDKHNCLISADARGVIEYWSSSEPHGLPSGGDWGLQKQGAITIVGSENVTVDSCFLTRLDGNAIFIGNFFFFLLYLYVW